MGTEGGGIRSILSNSGWSLAKTWPPIAALLPKLPIATILRLGGYVEREWFLFSVLVWKGSLSSGLAEHEGRSRPGEREGGSPL